MYSGAHVDMQMFLAMHGVMCLRIITSQAETGELCGTQCSWCDLTRELSALPPPPCYVTHLSRCSSLFTHPCTDLHFLTRSAWIYLMSPASRGKTKKARAKGNEVFFGKQQRIYMYIFPKTEAMMDSLYVSIHKLFDWSGRPCCSACPVWFNAPHWRSPGLVYRSCL